MRKLVKLGGNGVPPEFVCFLTIIVQFERAKMATATFLTMGLLFLLGLQRAEKRQNVVSREVQGLMEYTNDGYLIDEIPEL